MRGGVCVGGGGEGGGKSQFGSPAATVGGIVSIIYVFSLDSTRLSKLDF